VPGPALLEAVVDPYEPSMPPVIALDQAEKMARALTRGEPNRGRIALTRFRDQVEDFSAGASGPLEQLAEKVADLVGGDDRDADRTGKSTTTGGQACAPLSCFWRSLVRVPPHPTLRPTRSCDGDASEPRGVSAPAGHPAPRATPHQG
jgi:hypothetical protein